MGQQPDKLVDEELLNLLSSEAVNIASAGPNCLNDMDLLALLDTDAEELTISEHAMSCRRCSSRFAQLARLAEQPLTKANEDVLGKKVFVAPSGERVVSIKMLSEALETWFTNLQPVVQYRSEDPRIIVVEEAFGSVSFRIEFSKTIQGSTVDLAIELSQAPPKDQVVFELWRGESLLRSFSLRAGRKQSFSQWPAADYRLCIRLAETSIHTIDLRIR